MNAFEFYVVNLNFKFDIVSYIPFYMTFYRTILFVFVITLTSSLNLWQKFVQNYKCFIRQMIGNLLLMGKRFDAFLLLKNIILKFAQLA